MPFPPVSVLLCFLATAMFFGPAAGAEERSPMVIYAPKNIGQGETLPLVVLLHGYAGSAGEITNYFGLRALVDRRRFLLAVPEGLPDGFGKRHWNASAGCCDFVGRGQDDVGYIFGELARLRAIYPVDPARIYAAGHSNGGFLAHRLACEPGNPLAAIFSLAGQAPFPAACVSQRPISVLQLQAVDDSLVHYGGGRSFSWTKPYPGAGASLEMWAEKGRCGPARTAPPRDEVFGIPGNDTDVLRWDCPAGLSVELRSIRPFLAPWHFSHYPSLPPSFARELLDFLLSHRLPTP